MLVVGLLAGLFLVAMAWQGPGRYVRLIPLPVIEGFTLGIAALIALPAGAVRSGGDLGTSTSSSVAAERVVEWLGRRSPRPSP